MPCCAAGGEDGTVRVWDLRSPGCQREYGSRAAVNTVVLHPNQGELISGVLGELIQQERQAQRESLL
jgi:WD40 repeat protein